MFTLSARPPEIELLIIMVGISSYVVIGAQRQAIAMVTQGLAEDHREALDALVAGWMIHHREILLMIKANTDSSVEAQRAVRVLLNAGIATRPQLNTVDVRSVKS